MFVKRLTSACVLAGALIGGLGSCAGEQEALIVLGAPAWASDSGAGACFVDANVDAYLSFGVLDMYCLESGGCEQVLNTAYWIPTALQSNVAPQTTESNSGTDNSEVQLKEVDVSIRSQQVEEVIDHMKGQNEAFVDFTLPLASDSLPGGKTKGVIVEAINEATAAALYDAIVATQGGFTDITILVSLTFHAERTGNTVGNVGELSSREFQFPIKVCSGCLLNCDACEEGECENTDLGSLTFSGGVCGNTQDGPITPTACGG